MKNANNKPLSRIMGHCPGQCYAHNYKPCNTPIKCAIGKLLSNLESSINTFNIWLFRNK